MDEFSDGTKIFAPKDNFGTVKREWVGLTDEEFEKVLTKYNEALPMVVCQAIEAKLKEKNT